MRFIVRIIDGSYIKETYFRTFFPSCFLKLTTIYTFITLKNQQ